MTESFDWRPVGAVDPLSLVEARNQAHHALQIPAMAAIAFVPPRDDFSHINFGWFDQYSAFISHPIPTDKGTVQFGLRLADLTLLILIDGTLHLIYPMHDRTTQEAQDWLLSATAKLGLLTDKFEDHAPSDIPHHPVANGAAYDVEGHAQEMAEFCNYYGNAHLVLATTREAYLDIHPGSNEIRLWPHHFDMAVLVTVEEGDADTAKAFGFGFEPGDHTCEQPYFYTYPWPRSQRPETLPPLTLGDWTEPGTWLGTWLKGETIVHSPAADQRSQVETYLKEGADQCRIVATNHP
jgi:hypothetical protein